MDNPYLVIIFSLIILGILFVVFIKLCKIESQINNLCREKRERIKRYKKDGFYCKEMLEDEIEDYNLQIEELKNKRIFLLEKLPFLKK